RRFESAASDVVPSGLPTYEISRDGTVTLNDGYMSVAGGRFSSAAPLVAWSYEVAPATLFSVQAGPRYSQARNAIQPEISVTLARKAADIVNFGADYWRGESIVLGVLGPVEVNSATGMMSWPIRTNIELGVHAGLFDSQTLS